MTHMQRKYSEEHYDRHTHLMHMQVCTPTDAALPCKMLFHKLTTPIICC